MAEERKIQVVTGGTSGMGKATAIALGAFGPVLVGGRNPERLAQAVAEVEAAGVEAYGKTCDVGDRASVEEFAAYAASIAPIGNVIHAAGVDSAAGDSATILRINMGGTINVADVFLPYMEDSALINFTSVTGYFYRPDAEDIAIWEQAGADGFCEKYLELLDGRDMVPGMEALGRIYLAYASSKSFCIYYTKANTTRFAKRGCQVFSIAPGTFDTPMFRNTVDDSVAASSHCPLGRVGASEEMADLIKKLLEPGHEYLTGCDIVMDGGMVASRTVKQID